MLDERWSRLAVMLQAGQRQKRYFRGFVHRLAADASLAVLADTLVPGSQLEHRAGPACFWLIASGHGSPVQGCRGLVSVADDEMDAILLDRDGVVEVERSPLVV